jgi:hypothetical protein
MAQEIIVRLTCDHVDCKSMAEVRDVSLTMSYQDEYSSAQQPDVDFYLPEGWKYGPHGFGHYCPEHEPPKKQ